LFENRYIDEGNSLQAGVERCTADSRWVAAADPIPADPNQVDTLRAFEALAKNVAEEIG